MESEERYNMKIWNVWDHGRWAFVKRVTFDYMTNYFMESILSCVSVENKNVLELGAGTGRLGYLALANKAKKITLIDSSQKAIKLSQQLFQTVAPNRFSIIYSDLFGYSPDEKYDLVFSAGLIEHFKGKERLRIIQKHVELTSQDCLIIHPADTLYAKFFDNNPLSWMLYGYQKSFSDQEINSYLKNIQPEISFIHKRFYPFYTVPFLHNKEWINKYLDNKFCGKLGGVIITHIKVKN